MDIEYIIVQAGGKGTRLEHLTENKPKALVPVNNLPMLFHLFRKYPKKKFIIIGDYKKEVLKKYLKAFADISYVVVDAEGTGTCAGLSTALSYVPEDEAFMLIWSDLILHDSFTIPEKDGDYVGLSQTFRCRWSYVDGEFMEEPSFENGVAGFFIFRNRALISDVDPSGEFVAYLKRKDLSFDICGLAGTKEFGLLSEYEQLKTEKCRPFNRITEEDDVIIKEAIDDQGRRLAELERNWYDSGIQALPKIYGLEPLRMEKIRGKNIYEYEDASLEEKCEILKKTVSALKELHELEKKPVNRFSLWEAYATKTFSRLDKIRNLVPMADRERIVINGRSCRNIFFHEDKLEKTLLQYKCDEFALIHGDCTFSNMMLRDDGSPVFIDPRGYFGFTRLYGDVAYDWAKLYYSIVGNYDQFNLKRFRLTIKEEGIGLDIRSSGWEETEKLFFDLIDTPAEDIRLLHAIIWLSLTTYAWQDYDSICGAFYNGLYYLEEVL